MTPLISVNGPWEIWRIEGLESWLKHVTSIAPRQKKVELTAPGGDIRNILSIDFSGDLTICYLEEYDGF